MTALDLAADPRRPPLDGLGLLQRGLQTMAFCLSIATLQWIVREHCDYAAAAVYSLAIGLVSWLWIDLGRRLLPPAPGTDWPAARHALPLVGSGIAAGYVLGTLAGDAWFGVSTWSSVQGRAQLRASLVITIAAGVVASGYFYLRHRALALQRQRDEARHRAAEARLKLLESQLEPHMLFNTLANLRVLIALDAAQAQAMLDRLIGFLRATLGASRREWHPLADEFERVADYLALMSIRMGPRLRTAYALPEALRTLPVPPLLLQPLVENAIRHGLEPQVDGGRLAVSAEAAEGVLRLCVRDTGAGLGPAATEGSRFGLQQVRERLAAVYGERAALSVERAADAEGGTLACVTLPLP
jgi:signal transduction histidine kinase